MRRLVIISTYYDRELGKVKVNYSLTTANEFDAQGFVYIPENDYIDMTGKQIRAKVCEVLSNEFAVEKKEWE